MIDRSQYPEHALLNQVAESEEERAEAVRILCGVTEQDLDAQIAWKLAPLTAACSGPCDNGRLPCPTPEACQRSHE